MICALLLNIITLSIPEVKVSDPDIILPLNKYIDLLNHQVKDDKIKYHLICRVENFGSQKIIYLAAATSIGEFWRNIPDAYSEFQDRLVFWYESKDPRFDDEEYKDFYKQFHARLIVDCSVDGVYDAQVEMDLLTLEYIGTYRYVVKNGLIKSARLVCDFPNDRFYRRGLTYDQYGNLQYSDGSYDLCSLDRPFRFERANYDPMNYIRNNSGIPQVVTTSHTVGLSLLINKSGKVAQVEVDNKDKILTEEQKLKLVNVVLKMPKWNPQTVNKRKVCYRVLFNL